MLIEVLISAALLITIVTAVLVGFDAAGHITSYQQQRSEANALAQQDEDRLRGLPIAQLSGLSQSSTVTENATQFTIRSTAQFRTEATGSASCSATGSADYILTTSKVSWLPNATSGPSHQVTSQSVITPGAGGALIVQVVNGQGIGVPNMSVTASGPTSVSSTTGSDGCSIFAGLTGGAYNVTVSQPGYVDKDGNSTPPANQQVTTVIEASTAVKPFQFALAGSISVTFTTIPYNGTQPVTTNADQITIFNNNMTYPGFRWAGTIGAYGSIVAGSNIFPFPSAYTVYAGSCSANDPSGYGAQDSTALVAPGQTANLQLQLPPLYLTVYSGTANSPGAPAANAHVVLTDQGCGGSPPTAGGTPPIKRTFATNSSGQLAYPGLPYGTYTVCADSNGGSNSVYAQQTGVANGSLTGTPVALYLGSGSSGQCI